MAWSYGARLFQESARIGFFTIQNTFFVKDLAIFVMPSYALFFGFMFWKKIFTFTRSNAIQFAVLSIYSVSALAVYPLKHPYFIIPIVFLNFLSFILLSDFHNDLFNQFVRSLSRMMRISFLLLFIWQLIGVMLVAKINWGFPQFLVINKLEKIANFNPGVLVADGIGTLPHSNVLPQFMGIFDDSSNKYFFSDIEKLKPELIFLTPRLRFNIGQLRPIIYFDYVYISSEILARKIELPAHAPVTAELIVSSLKSIYNFPIQTVSFRIFTIKDLNLIAIATCNQTAVAQAQWSIAEIQKCRDFSFKDLYGNEVVKVVPVPFSIIEEDPDLTLFEYFNFKDTFGF